MEGFDFPGIVAITDLLYTPVVPSIPAAAEWLDPRVEIVEPDALYLVKTNGEELADDVLAITAALRK